MEDNNNNSCGSMSSSRVVLVCLVASVLGYKSEEADGANN